MSVWTQLSGIEVKKDGKWECIDDPFFVDDVGGGRQMLEMWEEETDGDKIYDNEYGGHFIFTLRSIIESTNEYLSKPSPKYETKSWLQERLEEKRIELDVDPKDLRIRIYFDY